MIDTVAQQEQYLSELLNHVQAELGITPATDRFSAEFEQLQANRGHDKNR